MRISSSYNFFFVTKLIINIKIKEVIIPTTVIFICPAPQPNPVAITKKRYMSSSGSLIAALNLTIERAPTSPRDKANDYFTIVITIAVAKPKPTKFFEKSFLFESDLENFI